MALCLGMASMPACGAAPDDLIRLAATSSHLSGLGFRNHALGRRIGCRCPSLAKLARPGSTGSSPMANSSQPGSTQARMIKSAWLATKSCPPAPKLARGPPTARRSAASTDVAWSMARIWPEAPDQPRLATGDRTSYLSPGLVSARIPRIAWTSARVADRDEKTMNPAYASVDPPHPSCRRRRLDPPGKVRLDPGSPPS